jgi:hypothetical protein
MNEKQRRARREFTPEFRLSPVTCTNGLPKGSAVPWRPARFAPSRAAWRRAEGKWREILAPSDQNSAPIWGNAEALEFEYVRPSGPLGLPE